MKLLSLNTWGGRAGIEDLLRFIEEKSKTVDIFCFQEIWHVEDAKAMQIRNELEGTIVGGIVLENIVTNIFPQIASVLPKYQGFFRPHYGDHYGLAMFIRKDLSLIEEGDIFVFKDRDFVPNGDVGNHARNIQYAHIKTNEGVRTVINFHGLWNGKGKTDSNDRLEQSNRIADFLKDISNPVIFCGDFNLMPDTKSLKILEDTGLRNLIKEFNINSTRTSIYKKPIKFADYILTSKEIKVNEFKILPEEVSDHSAIYLDFI